MTVIASPTPYHQSTLPAAAAALQYPHLSRPQFYTSLDFFYPSYMVLR